VKTSIPSGVSASLPRQCEDAMDLSFGEMKRVKALAFSNSKRGKRRSIAASLKKEKVISLEKGCKSPI